jgi:small conductance mechanosensitive channel
MGSSQYVDPEILYDKLYNWLLTVGPRLLMAILLVFIGIWIIRLVKKWLKRAFLRKRLSASFRPFLVSLVVTAMQIILILAVLQMLGVRMTIFTALIGAIGVAIGLALSGTLQNFTSGIIILLLKPFRVGDNIVAQGHDGIVSSIQLFYTVVITFDNKTVIIPNSKLSNEVIINISRQGKRRLDLEIKFNYGFDFSTIKAVVSDTLKKMPESADHPVPRIGVSVLDPDGFKVMINSWVEAKDFENSKLMIQQRVIEDLKAAGIKLPGMK